MISKLNSNLFQIEIDVDGVLADMDGSYAPYLKDLIPDFTEWGYIFEWSMPSVREEYPKAFERVQKLWVNPDFVYSLPRFSGVTKGMNELYQLSKGKAEIVVHTHLFEDGEVYNSRVKWLENLREESLSDFTIKIATGGHKPTLRNSKVVIEDSVRNLQKSNADYKFLVRRAHNRNYSEKDLGNCKYGFVVKDFYEAVQIIKGIKKLWGEAR